tara:strand:- start:483 stop:1490 length:1008 start_codon:yes stop_codon:yes gene_type:complete
MSDQIIGKLSDDTVMSCSRLPALFGISSYSTPNDELRSSFEAVDREASKTNGAAPNRVDTFATRAGNHNENFILREGAKNLMLEIDTQITERVVHPTLPLQGSLDGILEGDGRILSTDTGRNIYVIGQDEIELDGPGVAEAKLTQDRVSKEPRAYRGPIQCQGLMMCTGYRWSAIFTSYGTSLHTFLISQDQATQMKIEQDVIDFQSRIDTYRKEGMRDWYPALHVNDAAATYNEPEKGLEPVNLDDELSQMVLDLQEAKRTEKAVRDLQAKYTARIMDFMGKHDMALARDGNGDVIAEVSWGMSNAIKEHVRKAVPARRAKTLKVIQTKDEEAL